jgi:pyridoxal phosphate enzyme (YggS family)
MAHPPHPSQAAAFIHVRAAIDKACSAAGRSPDDVTLVAVSKTHDGPDILPVLEAGHRVFGENRVQEAKGKWPALRAAYQDVELHLIGPLQSNKAADAVALFDVIQSVDRDKLVAVLSQEMLRQKKHPKLFVQVNTGLEPQKAGIAPQELAAFLARSDREHGMRFAGLMCIPPADEDPVPHFNMLAQLARANGLAELSMGMSSDFAAAIAAGASLVRVGSAIFGARPAAHPPAARSPGT